VMARRFTPPAYRGMEHGPWRRVQHGPRREAARFDPSDVSAESQTASSAVAASPVDRGRSSGGQLWNHDVANQYRGVVSRGGTRHQATCVGTDGGTRHGGGGRCAPDSILWTCAGRRVGGLTRNTAQKLPEPFGWAWASLCRGTDQDQGEGRWASAWMTTRSGHNGLGFDPATDVFRDRDRVAVESE